MAAVVCTQCGAEAPHTAEDIAADAPKRCRFCGEPYASGKQSGAQAQKTPPPPVFGMPPPRRTEPQAAASVASAQGGAASAPLHKGSGQDRLSLPFDAQDITAAPPPKSRRWPWVVGLAAAAALGAAILTPVQMGLSPGWYRSILGPRVDSVAQQELAHGRLALDRGSSRGLVEAKQSFERALKIDAHFPAANAALAEAHLAMAQALRDAAQDMTYFSQGLTRKEMRRAQHDAQTQREEAKAWLVAATPWAQAAVQLAPNTPYTSRVMADLLRLEGDTKGADAWAQSGRIGPSDEAGMMVVQADLLAGHDLSGAAALLSRALLKAPGNNRARYKLAQVLLKRKDHAHALEAVNAILAAAPEHELAQQMLMRLQPAASQADKVQRPLVLSFANELHAGAVAPAPELQAALVEAGGAAAPPARAPEAPGAPGAPAADAPQPAPSAADTGNDGDADEAPIKGPPLTFVAQAKRGVKNIWQSLEGLWSGQVAAGVPEAVAPSDLGGGMPLPSGPLPAPAAQAAPATPAQAAAAAPAEAAAQAPQTDAALGTARPLPTHSVVDTVVKAAAQAPVTAFVPESKSGQPAPDLGHLPADVMQLGAAELVHRADGLREAHHAAEALPLYQLAAKRAPLEMAGLLGVGYCALETGAPQTAADAFTEALRRGSWQAEPHFGLAQAQLALGHSRDAVGHLRRYLMIEPGGPRATQARQMLEELSK